MKDITSAKWMYIKAALLLLGGMMSAVIILIEYPTLKVALMLGISIWCFSRAYYFAFYVIEHYIDPSYKFSGLWSFVLYTIKKKK